MRPFMRLFVILIVFGAFPAHAQSARPAITAANASTVVELARFGQGQVSAAAWSPDGKQLAVGGSLGVWLYDRSDFTLPPRLLDSHSGWISSLAYNGDGSLLALRSNTGIVQVWNVQTEELRQTIDVPIHPYGGRLHVAFSPDGTRLVTDGAKEAPGLWDVQTGAKIATLNDWITDVIYSPDGKTFVLGTIDGQVQVWDAQLGELLRQYEILIESIAAPNTIDKLAYSYDNSLLAVGREDGTILLLDARTGEIVKTWKGHACEYLSGTFYEAALSCEIYSLAFSPDGKTLVSGAKDGLMKLWDVATGEHWKTFDDARVQELAFSPDGTLLTMVGSDNVVRLWNTTTYDHDLILDGFNNTPEKALEFSPDGSLLAAADYYNGGLLHFWDTESWVEQAAWKATLDDIADLAFAPDGHELVASQAEQLIQKWWIGDSINGVVYFLDYYDLPSFRLSSLAYSPDGDMLAFGGCVDEEGDYFCNYTHVGMDGFYAPELKDRHDGEVDDIAFSPDGTLLAAAEICGYEGQVQVWDTRSGETFVVLETTKREGARAVTFSPDGTLLAVGYEDHTVRLWDVNSMQNVAEWEGHSDAVRKVAFSPDGTVLASASDDATIRLWDVKSGETLAVLEGHTGWVWNIAFNADGTLLASSSRDGTVRLWGVPVP